MFVLGQIDSENLAGSVGILAAAFGILANVYMRS